MEKRIQAAQAAYRLGNMENAISICRAGIAEAQSMQDQVRLRVLLSLCLWVKGGYEEALSLTGLPDSSALSDPLAKSRLLNQRGFVFTQLGRFAEARTAIEEALRLATASNLLEVVGEIEVNRGTLFFYLRDYEFVET